MTSLLNLEDIYNEINSLLKDVCSFLNSETQNGTLSATARNEAEKLVARSVKQVEVISNITVVLQDNATVNYPYLQMQRPPATVQENISEYVDTDRTNYDSDVYEESYDQIGSDTSETQIINSTSLNVEENSCPYEDLPVCSLQEKAIKAGPLCRKERYFILEQKKNLFAGLIDYYLLIYSSNNKKDMKPIQILNLIGYHAHALEQKKDYTFELSGENKKSYEFIARSEKDMIQWIVAINYKKQTNYNNRNLPQIPVNTEVDNFHDNASINNNKTANNISDSSTDDLYNECDIYENLDELHEKKTEKKNNQTFTECPKLPIRKNTHFPEYNNLKSDDNNYESDDEENTYDPVQNGDGTDEIVEDEEEEIYAELKNDAVINHTSLKPIQIHRQNSVIEDDTDENYDIPRAGNFDVTQSTSKNKEIESEEDIEYDELKDTKNDCKTNQTCNSTLNQTPEKSKNVTTKPGIISPKPKLQSFLSRKSDSSQESNNRIHNIIQQMEVSLSFKSSKN